MLLCVLIGLFNIVLRHRGDAYTEGTEIGRQKWKKFQSAGGDKGENIIRKKKIGENTAQATALCRAEGVEVPCQAFRELLVPTADGVWNRVRGMSG